MSRLSNLSLYSLQNVKMRFNVTSSAVDFKIINEKIFLPIIRTMYPSCWCFFYAFIVVFVVGKINEKNLHAFRRFLFLSMLLLLFYVSLLLNLWNSMPFYFQTILYTNWIYLIYFFLKKVFFTNQSLKSRAQNSSKVVKFSQLSSHQCLKPFPVWSFPINGVERVKHDSMLYADVRFLKNQYM